MKEDTELVSPRQHFPLVPSDQFCRVLLVEGEETSQPRGTENSTEIDSSKH